MKIITTDIRVENTTTDGSDFFEELFMATDNSYPNLPRFLYGDMTLLIKVSEVIDEKIKQ